MARLSTDRDDLVEYLSLLGLDSDTLMRQFIERVRPDIIDAKGPVFGAGDPAEHFYLVMDDSAGDTGTLIEISVDRGDSGRTSPLERVVGGIFGEMEFVGRDEFDRFPARLFSARALNPVRLIRIPFRPILALDPETLALVDRRLAATTVERYRQHALVAEAGRSSNRAALLAATILQLADDAGVKEGGGRRLTVKKTQQQLADEVGLTREVVNGHLNEWGRAGLLSFEQGGLVVRDFDRFRRIVELQQSRSRANHDRALQRIANAIANGDNFRARNLALEALRFFPTSPELQHQAVLALVRGGSLDEAERLIARFGFEPEQTPRELRERLLRGLRNPLRRVADGKPEAGGGDGEMATDDDEDAGVVQRRIDTRLPPLLEDVLALPARVRKDRFWRDKGGDATASAEQASATYARAYQAIRRPYVGINAASLALVAGDREQAQRLARGVLNQVPDRSKTYWDLATRGEAFALLQDWEKSKAVFQAAANAKEATPGAIASTRLQLRRLAPYLGDPGQSLIESLAQVGVAAFSGHMMLAGQMTGAQQNEALARLVPAVKAAVEKHNIGLAYGALAAGADIAFAEAVLAERGAFHAVLPFRVEDFVKLSVAPGMCDTPPGPDWQRLFMACLAAARSLTTVWSERLAVTAKADVDDILHATGRRIVGQSLLKADELVTEPTVLAIYDGCSPQSVAGTAQLLTDCEEAGVKLDVIACDWRKSNAQLAKAGVGQLKPSVCRPVLFIWLAAADGDRARKKSPMQIDKLFKDAEKMLKGVLGRDVRYERRVIRSASTGLVVAFDRCEAALEGAYALLDSPMADKFELRLVCDFGPVGRPGQALNSDRLSKLDGANDIPELPTGLVAASEAFAAEARFAGAGKVLFNLMGRVSPAQDARAQFPLPSVPLYRPVVGKA